MSGTVGGVARHDRAWRGRMRCDMTCCATAKDQRLAPGRCPPLGDPAPGAILHFG